jgi:hypothetical protein
MNKIEALGQNLHKKTPPRIGGVIKLSAFCLKFNWFSFYTSSSIHTQNTSWLND